MKRIRKKLLSIFFLLLTCVTMLTPVTAQAASKKPVKITCIKSGTTLAAGQTKSLGVKTSTKSKLSYKTSNSKIAKVKSGKLYTYNPGSVKVTITAKPLSKKYKAAKKSVTIKVTPQKPATPTVKRSGEYLTASVKKTKGAGGYQFQYSTSSKMGGATNKSTSKTSYKFKAASNKTFYVRARAYKKVSGKTYYSAWSGIRKIAGQTTASKDGVTLNKTSVTLKKYYATVQLTANKTVTWSSSNKKVATVSSSGKVTSMSNGNCTIKAKAKDGSYATCSVTVNIPDKPGTKVPTTHIVLDTWNLTLTKKGQTYKLNPTVYPSNASNKNAIIWSTNNPEAATVDKNGVITAHSYGHALITATIINYTEIINKNGDADLEEWPITDDCAVIVNIPKEEAPKPAEPEVPKPPTPQKYDSIDLGGAFGNTSCPVQAISYLLTPGVLGDPIPEEVLSSPTHPWALVPNGEALKGVTFELYGNKDCVTTDVRLQPNERIDLLLKPVPLKEGKVTVVAKYNGNVIYVWDVNVHKTYPS